MQQCSSYPKVRIRNSEFSQALDALKGLRPEGRMIIMGFSNEPLNISAFSLFFNLHHIIGSQQNESTAVQLDIQAKEHPNDTTIIVNGAYGGARPLFLNYYLQIFLLVIFYMELFSWGFFFADTF